MRLSRDSLAGLICLGLSLGMLYLTQGLPKSPLVPIGPDFYPRLVLLVSATLSAALIAVDLIRARRAVADVPTLAAPPWRQNYRLVALGFAMFGIYVGLLPLLGFRLATFLFVAGFQMTLQPPRAFKPAVIAAVVALATSLGSHVVFEHYLFVLLPRGSWTGF